MPLVITYPAIPGQGPSTQAQEGIHRLINFEFADLAGALCAVDKGNRHLANAKSGSLAQKGHLDQKAVAAAKNTVQRHGFQYGAAIAAETCCAVARGNA